MCPAASACTPHSLSKLLGEVCQFHKALVRWDVTPVPVFVVRLRASAPCLGLSGAGW